MPREFQLIGFVPGYKYLLSFWILFLSSFFSTYFKLPTASSYSLSMFLILSMYWRYCFSWRAMFKTVLLSSNPILSRYLLSRINIRSSFVKLTLYLFSPYFIRIGRFSKLRAVYTFFAAHSMKRSVSYLSSYFASLIYWRVTCCPSGLESICSWALNLIIGVLIRCIRLLAQLIAPAIGGLFFEIGGLFNPSSYKFLTCFSSSW